MNERTNMTDELDAAEGLIAGGQADLAVELLERLAADAEEYVDRNCPTTDEVQWFSFPTIFERLCYRRVEKDPRELRDVGEPLDRLYADLAFALVNEGDYAAATEALRQAVRWNPMGCGYRLDLAELYRTNGDVDEYLALTFSVFERASDVRHLVRAFCNFARHFMDTGADSAAAAALRCARRLDWPDAVLEDLLERAKGTRADPDSLLRRAGKLRPGGERPARRRQRRGGALHAHVCDRLRRQRGPNPCDGAYRAGPRPRGRAGREGAARAHPQHGCRGRGRWPCRCLRNASAEALPRTAPRATSMRSRRRSRRASCSRAPR